MLMIRINCAWSHYWGQFGLGKANDFKKLLISRRSSVTKAKYSDIEKYLTEVKKIEGINGEISELQKAEKNEPDSDKRKQIRKKWEVLQQEAISLSVSLKRDHSVVFEIDEDLDPQGIIDNFLNPNAPSNIGVSRRKKNTKKTDQNETDNKASWVWLVWIRGSRGIWRSRFISN
jgi:hypothetical protein